MGKASSNYRVVHSRVCSSRSQSSSRRGIAGSLLEVKVHARDRVRPGGYAKALLSGGQGFCRPAETFGMYAATSNSARSPVFTL